MIQGEEAAVIGEIAVVSDLVWIRSDDCCISDSYVSGISIVTIEETSSIINFSSLGFIIVTSQ
jgi:hypothetical protein